MITLFQKKQRAGTVFKTDFGEGFVIWKLLPWNRYKIYREARLTVGPRIDIELEEAVYEECVIFSSFDVVPPSSMEEAEQGIFISADRDFQDGGVISTVVKMILYMSGARRPEELFDHLEKHRRDVGNIEEQLLITICKAFPSYTPEDLESLDWQTILKRAAQAEAVLMGYNVELPLKAHEPEESKPVGMDIDKLVRESEKNLGPSTEEPVDRRAAARDMRERYMRERFS